MHSTFSDGEFTPEELVEIAVKNKVSILSLTDHDTFGGITDLVTDAEKVNIFAFPGIEITVNYQDFNLHLLAYFKNPDSIEIELKNRVSEMKALRENRMRELIEKINMMIKEKQIRNLDDYPVEEALQDGLIRDDGKIIYPVRDCIPVMLIGEGIPMKQFD